MSAESISPDVSPVDQIHFQTHLVNKMRQNEKQLSACFITALNWIISSTDFTERSELLKLLNIS